MLTKNIQDIGGNNYYYGMALFPRVVEAIVGLHKVHQFKGPVVSLGVQDTILNYMQVEPMLRNAEMLVHPVPRQERRNTTNRSILNMGLDNAIHGSTFFALLGIHPYDDVDISDAEQASLVHDLNNPVPESWHGRCNILLDGGCLEHVSNFGMGLTNSLRMLAVGGYAFYSNPLNHLVNHGYFQVSPVLLRDFWETNGGEVLYQYVFAQENNNWRSPFLKPLTRPTSKTLKFHNNEYQYWLITLIRKTKEVDTIQWPRQKDYLAREGLLPIQ